MSNQDVLPITIVIPVKNEAIFLPACLKSLEGFAEILVVDSGSTDGTQDIALRAGCTVIDFKWNGGFPKKRNWALQTYAFKTDWVLFLDADERIGQDVKAELARKISSGSDSAYWLNYHNHFMGKVLRHGVLQRKLAMFRRDRGMYERIEDKGWSALDMEVHEHPVIEGSVGEIAAPLEHEGYRGFKHFIGRHNEYSSWEAGRYLALRGDAEAWAKLYPRQRRKYANLASIWFGPAYFVYTYIARAGFLDGRTGFIYAALKAIYFFEVSIKIHEAKAARPDPVTIPGGVNASGSELATRQGRTWEAHR